MVLSADPVANHWLPGSTATDLTQPVWPLTTCDKQSQMAQLNYLKQIVDTYIVDKHWQRTCHQGTIAGKQEKGSFHLHTWVGRGTVRAKCLVQEHNRIGANLDYSVH